MRVKKSLIELYRKIELNIDLLEKQRQQIVEEICPVKVGNVVEATAGYIGTRFVIESIYERFPGDALDGPYYSFDAFGYYIKSNGSMSIHLTKLKLEDFKIVAKIYEQNKISKKHRSV